mmetsp:Transcript_21939/g.36280  ORF Transcript_21939/g.36280 Transcript_21939/m.36280 type:complete len:204 (+) Transcript_21939:739-1350(+)
MQVDGNDTVDTHGFHEASDVSSRNWDTSLHFTILSGITIVWNNNRNSSGTGSVQRRDEKEQLHNVVIDWRARWLNDIAILSTNILVNHDIRFTIRKTTNRGLAQIDSQITTNLECQRHVAVARENLEAPGMFLGLASCLFNGLFCFRHANRWHRRRCSRITSVFLLFTLFVQFLLHGINGERCHGVLDSRTGGLHLRFFGFHR